MKIRSFCAMAIGTAALIACGSSHSTTGASSSGAGGVCANPNAPASNACVACFSGLSSTEACVQAFAATCSADERCVAYDQCLIGCRNETQGGVGGSGGGSTACAAADGMGGAGGAAANCKGCCFTTNPAGESTYVETLIQSCICAPGAPCAAACQ